MFHPRIDVRKPGVKHLNQTGDFAVIANKKLYDSGKAHRYAVVNAHEQWLESIHPSYRQALSHSRGLS